MNIRLNLLAWLLVELVIINSLYSQVLDQQAWMVYDKTCIESIEIAADTRLEMPMVDGKPDKTRAKLVGVVANYNSKCGRIEIRKALR